MPRTNAHIFYVDAVAYLTNYTSSDRQIHEHSKRWEQLCIESFGIVPPRTTINPYVPKNSKPEDLNLDLAYADPIATSQRIMANERILSQIDPTKYNAKAIVEGKQELMSNVPPMTPLERARFSYWTSLTEEQKLALGKRQYVPTQQQKQPSTQYNDTQQSQK